jgi:hypothetical protein
MIRKKIMWHLCAGLGGACQAFEGDDKWQVYRIDNNPKLVPEVPGHYQIEDLLKWEDWIPKLLVKGRPDLIIVGPPCRDFSNGYSGPKMTWLREGNLLEDYEPDMSLVFASMEIIEHVKPKWWMLENVFGSVPYIEPHLGQFTQIIGPFILWGKFPFIRMPDDYRHSKFENDTWSSDELRANRRAKWPKPISEAVKKAVDAQSSIFDW